MKIDVANGYVSVAYVSLLRVGTVAAEHDTAGRICVVGVRCMRVLQVQNGTEGDTGAAAVAAAAAVAVAVAAAVDDDEDEDDDVVVVVVAAAAAVMLDVVVVVVQLSRLADRQSD
jgi:hypothetical protein